MLKVKIDTHLSLNDYIKACFHLRYSRIGGYFATILALIYIIFSLTTIRLNGSPDWQILFTGVVYIAFIHGFVYLKARSSYLSNKKISENIVYEFDDTNLIVTGESFTGTSTIASLYKVTSTKNWLFIWPNNSIANIVSKKNLTELEIITLKEIFTRNNVKCNIK